MYLIKEELITKRQNRQVAHDKNFFFVKIGGITRQIFDDRFTFFREYFLAKVITKSISDHEHRRISDNHFD